MASASPILALLIEDDDRLARFTREYLEDHGFAVTHVSDGDRGLQDAMRNRYDVVLLDLMLPGTSGLDVCRELRSRSDVPILVLTARTEEADRVLGLELGADDYLAKPFSPRELVARVHAVLRRTKAATSGASTREAPIRSGSLLLDPGSRTASMNGRDLELTGYEFSLLSVLVSRAGRILSRDQLMELAKGNREESFDRSIDVHVSRLRKKLGDDAKRLKTIRGAGYLFATGGDA